MQRRSLLIAGLVFAALLVWTVFDRDDPSLAGPLITGLLPWQPLAPGDLRRLEVFDKGDRSAAIARGPAGWSIELGEGARALRADPDLMDDAVSALAGLRIERAMPPGGSLTEYGLDEGARELRLVLADGVEHRLRLGAPLLVGAGRYGLVDGGLVVLPAAPLISLDRDARDLIDRRLVPVDPASIDGLELLDGPTPVSLRRRGASFFLGDGRRADARHIQALLAALSELRLERLSADDDQEAARWMTVQAGATRVTIQRTADGARVVGPDGGERPASIEGLVGDPGLPPLPTADALWTERVLDLDPYRVTELRWRVGDDETRYVKTASGWKRGAEAQTAVPRDAVEDLLHDLVALAGRPQLQPASGFPLATLRGSHADGTTFGLQLSRSSDGFSLATDGEEGVLRPASAEVAAMLAPTRPQLPGEAAP